MSETIKAKENDRVSVHYEGKLEDGEVFESSVDTAPVSFRIGEGMVLPSLERAIIGMEQGQTRIVSIPPDEGYGPHYPDLVLTVARHSLGEREVRPGMVLAMNMEREGKTHRLPAMVLESNAREVKVDFNHPLAGRELYYTVTLTAIQPADE